MNDFYLCYLIKAVVVYVRSPRGGRFALVIRSREARTQCFKNLAENRECLEQGSLCTLYISALYITAIFKVQRKAVDKGKGVVSYFCIKL